VLEEVGEGRLALAVDQDVDTGVVPEELLPLRRVPGHARAAVDRQMAGVRRLHRRGDGEVVGAVPHVVGEQEQRGGDFGGPALGLLHRRRDDELGSVPVMETRAGPDGRQQVAEAQRDQLVHLAPGPHRGEGDAAIDGWRRGPAEGPVQASVGPLLVDDAAFGVADGIGAGHQEARSQQRVERRTADGGERRLDSLPLSGAPAGGQEAGDPDIEALPLAVAVGHPEPPVPGGLEDEGDAGPDPGAETGALHRIGRQGRGGQLVVVGRVVETTDERGGAAGQRVVTHEHHLGPVDHHQRAARQALPGAGIALSTG